MDIEPIEEAYGIKIKDIQSIKNVWRAETDCGVKCIKRAHMSPAFFLFIYSAVNHLKEKGYEGVIPYSTTIDGRICVPDDGHIYYMVDWVEARECKFKKEEDLKKAIKAAAELHRASLGYVPPEGAKPRVFYNRWVEKCNKKSMELSEFGKAIEDKECMDDFDKIFAGHLPYYLQQSEESKSMIMESPYREISEKSRQSGEFCHHDMANHNFLISEDGKAYLIDFDYCIMDTRLHDLTSLIIRNMRYGIWDIEKAYFILNEYDGIYSINHNDIKVIKAFITFPQDFWQVGLQYYVERQPWTMEYFLMRLNRIVNDREIRAKFLEEFLKL
ncbi:MAG: CotS family spore coat protein [Clostridiaceae bacterium]|nr:CotS family spore coat protein [Clostridiaceae bacterium]